ncbi:hypothetical protein [Denitromonas halophila]|uniref:Uncharacterized protein n=1 Tax=Denitromonas halophila TaxID=1629404 RepID=A0A557QVZ7_9RHOO|nr:hypothetical protein [Denitromonas halophila]TVO57095.1 hypothetical protein FHP91_10950 [Denitromonas halophila]
MTLADTVSVATKGQGVSPGFWPGETPFLFVSCATVLARPRQHAAGYAERHSPRRVEKRSAFHRMR